MLPLKTYCVIASCLLLASNTHGQDQRIADSLVRVYHQNALDDSAKSELLIDLSFNETRDLQKSLQYIDELLALAQKNGSDKYLRMAYFLKGSKKRLLGQLDEALEAYFKSAEISKRLKRLTAEGETYGAIADIYSVGENYSNAMHYYHKGIAILRMAPGDSINLASVISNAGEAFMKTKKYDSALLFFNEAKSIFTTINYPSGIGYSLGNIGMVYANVGRNQLAEENINEAIQILERAEDYYPVSVYLMTMSDVYLDKGDHQRALTYALRSLYLAEKHGLKQQISDASLKMSQLYERAGNTEKAFKHYKRHIEYRDSVNNLQMVKNMFDQRTRFENSQQEIEVNMLKKEKQNQRIIVISLFVILGLTILLLGSVYWFFKSKSREKLRLHQQELLHARLEIQEQTYLNISQELHDNIGQVLSVVKMTINTVAKRIDADSKEKIEESVILLSKAIQDIRDMSKTLNTDFLNDIGLPNAIDQQLQILKRTGLYCTELSVHENGEQFQAERNLLIFRVVQELLNNIVKHANADKIIVSMNYEKEKLVIRVCDNGSGFDTEMQRKNSNKGLGLRNMQNRLKLIRGSIALQSQPGKGTTAVIEILH